MGPPERAAIAPNTLVQWANGLRYGRHSRRRLITNFPSGRKSDAYYEMTAFIDVNCRKWGAPIIRESEFDRLSVHGRIRESRVRHGLSSRRSGSRTGNSPRRARRKWHP